MSIKLRITIKISKNPSLICDFVPASLVGSQLDRNIMNYKTGHTDKHRQKDPARFEIFGYNSFLRKVLWVPVLGFTAGRRIREPLGTIMRELFAPVCLSDGF